MFEFETPYMDMYRTKVFVKRNKPTVLHGKTCPLCGRKLVNLYYMSQTDDYICNKCINNLYEKQ